MTTLWQPLEFSPISVLLRRLTPVKPAFRISGNTFATRHECRILEINLEAWRSILAAWVALVKVKPNRWKGHGLKPWIEVAKKRWHHNVLAIALANKLAGIAWSGLARGRRSHVH